MHRGEERQDGCAQSPGGRALGVGSGAAHSPDISLNPLKIPSCPIACAETKRLGQLDDLEVRIEPAANGTDAPRHRLIVDTPAPLAPANRPRGSQGLWRLVDPA